MGVAVLLQRYSTESHVRLLGSVDLTSGQITDPVQVVFGGFAVTVYPAAIDAAWMTQAAKDGVV